MEAIASGEIMEEHPEDKYWPSYLIFGTIWLKTNPTSFQLLLMTRR
jgi:hypothetical protein